MQSSETLMHGSEQLLPMIIWIWICANMYMLIQCIELQYASSAALRQRSPLPLSHTALMCSRHMTTLQQHAMYMTGRVEQAALIATGRLGCAAGKAAG